MKLLYNAILIVSGLLAGQVATAATYTVTNPSGSIAEGTLSWALTQADINPGPDTIRFSIGTGPVTVTLGSQAYIFDQVTIDGTTQPGYTGNPVVTVLMSNPFSASYFSVYGAGTQIKGLAFATKTNQATVGIYVNNCSVENCWFGLDHELVPAQTYRAIEIGGSSTSVTNAEIVDCMMGNMTSGIRAQNVTNLDIIDCIIGTDISGTAVYPCSGSGIILFDCDDAYIGPKLGGDGCIIANCGGDGVGLLNSASTVIIGNRIYNCGELPIDHGLDDNASPIDHNQDSDIATGGSQNRPSLSLAITKTGGSIHTTGTLNTTPSTDILLEFYASEELSAVRQGQGQHRIGVATVTTDASGNVEFDETFVDTLPGVYPVYISATATRMDQSWGTSEFSFAYSPLNATISLESNPGDNAAWVPSGIDSGPEHTLYPASIDDVDVEKTSSELSVIVRPSSGRFRVAGWTNPSVAEVPPYAATVFRGKFYVYTSTPAAAALNTVPNFRLRLENEGVVLASTTYEFAATGNTAVPHEPYYGLVNNSSIETRAGQSLRPTDSSISPSLYRVDFVPVPTFDAGGSRIGATFESYAGPDTADGTLALTEIQIAAYNQLAASEITFINGDDPDFAATLGYPSIASAATLGSGAFNVENDFQPGRRQALDLQGEVPLSELATISTEGTDYGTIIDTLNTPENKIGVGIFNIEAANHVEAPRIGIDSYHVALFVASSDMPAEPESPGQPVQGSVSFQLQTGGGAITSRLELMGPAPFAGAPGSLPRTIAAQALPGKNSQNLLLNTYPFKTGEHGGAYMVFLPPVLSPDIRRTTPLDLGPLEDEPGPGVNLPSYRDITMAVNAIEQPTTMRLTPDLVVPWAPPNRARVRVHGVVLVKLIPLDDGGYIF